MAQKITVEVAKKQKVTEKTYFVTFRLVDPTELKFTAGQNMMLMIPAGAGKPSVHRTMSIASPPQEKTELLMVHDISPMGLGSQWTINAKVGDRICAMAPTGGALSFLESSNRKVMVATGTGIAPFHSMIFDAVRKSASPDRADSGPDMALYWGLRHERDMYWKEEFERVVPLHLSLSQPSDTWQGLHGHITRHVFEHEHALPESEFYLCGNRAMVEEMREQLRSQGVRSEQIRSELFY